VHNHGVDADIVTVQQRLRTAQGPFVPKPKLPVIDEMIATVLSQHTSDHNSERAFAQLKAKFPTWGLAMEATGEQIADAIRSGGMASQKAERILRILAAIQQREGHLDLSGLRDRDDDAIQEYLTSLPGVGPKTAACVLVFSMGRPAFPIDTHVHRIVTRLGWIPAKTTADATYRILNPLIPPELRYDLHLAFITHGRTVCKAQNPRCGDCVLADLCSYKAAQRNGSDSTP
jgi:endonuclease-3